MPCRNSIKFRDQLLSPRLSMVGDEIREFSWHWPKKDILSSSFDFAVNDDDYYNYMFGSAVGHEFRTWNEAWVWNNEIWRRLFLFIDL
jgi:hypothetical protein